LLIKVSLLQGVFSVQWSRYSMLLERLPAKMYPSKPPESAFRYVTFGNLVLLLFCSYSLLGGKELSAQTVPKVASSSLASGDRNIFESGGLPVIAAAGGPDDIYPQLQNGVDIAIDIKAKLDEILGPTQTAFDTTMDLYSKLADAVVGNQHPPKPEHPYSIDGFAFAVDAAATRLAAANFNPQVLNPSQYSVSFDQLSGCRTQRSALDRLNGYGAAMDRAAADGQGTLQALNARLNVVTKFEALAREFSEVALRASAGSALEWNVYFASAWWDLDQHLVPAFANLRSVLKQQIATVTKNVAALQTQSGNLKANLKLITPGSCLLGGSWSGTCTTQGTGKQATTTLTLATSGTGTALINNVQTFNVSRARISNYSHLDAYMEARNGQLIYAYNISGNFDPSYSSATLTLTSPSPHNRPVTCPVK
jgi:hypothetical protein